MATAVGPWMDAGWRLDQTNNAGNYYYYNDGYNDVESSQLEQILKKQLAAMLLQEIGHGAIVLQT